MKWRPFCVPCRPAALCFRICERFGPATAPRSSSNAANASASKELPSIPIAMPGRNGRRRRAIEQAIRSNQVNLTISNLVVSNLFGSNGLGNVGITNFPTNYPDAAAIGLLSQIATNTARTNGFDTNLDSLAAQIASNTAAPLAYTNLCLPAYSTNPSDVVAYASNTLAGPINGSLQGLAQSASTAAEAVTVGGTPG